MININLKLSAAIKNIATKYKTLYVMGCFGAPMNAANKQRYCNNHSYNRRADRTAMIRAASGDTLDQTYAVKSKRIPGGRKDHFRAVSTAVIGMVITVPLFIGGIHGSAKAAHDIKRFIVICNVF